MGDTLGLHIAGEGAGSPFLRKQKVVPLKEVVQRISVIRDVRGSFILRHGFLGKGAAL